MTLHWPQLVYLAMMFLGLGLAWEKHGKPKKGTENAWATLIATTIVFALLYIGGFFG